MKRRLDVRALQVRAGDKVLVDVESFSVSPGALHAVVGPSGSGKTTLARALVGVSQPGVECSGEVIFGELSWKVGTRAPRESGIGLLIQESSNALHPLMKIQAQLAEARRYARTPFALADEALLAELAIADPSRVLGCRPHELSGGMRQRLALGLLLVIGHDALCIDEPTTAIDQLAQAEVLALLRKLMTAHELSVVLISHDLSVVRSVADSVSVMSQGRIVETGTATEIFSQPAHRVTKALLASAPSLATRGSPLPVALLEQ